MFPCMTAKKKLLLSVSPQLKLAEQRLGNIAIDADSMPFLRVSKRCDRCIAYRPITKL
jgi:hypothetical protein